jgi:pimeloyl-ACP methyl ester carboxylesterase
VNVGLAILATVAVAAALWNIHAQYAGVDITPLNISGTPATIYRPISGAPAPVVVIAHGFAGSGRLMQSFALTFARNGYIAVTFDFPGHGRNPRPLAGNVAEVGGATRRLVDETAKVAQATRGLGDGRLAVLGHSMASDIVVRFAEAHPEVAATIAVSTYSPAVTATAPKNLLMIAGDWEGFLKTEALHEIGLATAPAAAEPGVTYGDFSAGTARRAAFSAHVEHASVLFSQDSMRESLRWLDETFGITRATPPALDARGPWILVLLAGVVALARPLFALLPVVAVPRAGAGLNWRRVWAPMLIPVVATPLLLRVLPTHFLPVLVGDYLAVHFAVYGLIEAGCLIAFRSRAAQTTRRISPLALAVAALLVTAYGFVAVFWPIDAYVTSFLPGPERWPLVAALLVGTLMYFLSDEWLTRGIGAARGAYPASKLAFLVSLTIALALDFQRLFFLILILPIIALFFIVYGLFSGWAYRRAGHPFVAGVANAIAFAWAIGVTFPLVAG